jgi:20S proteasome subunit beta 2
MEYLSQLPVSEFNGELQHRNNIVEKQGSVLPKQIKTGTTIVGCVFNGGVCLAADTRATSGETVSIKTTEKLHYLAPNIWVAGAGTAADCQFVSHSLSCQLELLRFKTRQENRLETARTLVTEHLFRYGGFIGAYLIFAGVDCTGPQLISVSADGASHSFPFTTMGSGSLAAMTVFETQFQDNMTKEQAIEVCANAIQAGIVNDMGSGSNVDVVTITREEGAQYQRGYRKFNAKAYTSPQEFNFPVGTTPIKGTYELVTVDAMDIE